MAVFLGHLYPVFYRFKGGKGVATAFGVLLGLSPWLALAGFSGVCRDRVGHALCLAGERAGGGVRRSSGTFHPWVEPLTGAVILIAALVVARHKANLKRLVAGKESKLRFRKTRSRLTCDLCWWELAQIPARTYREASDSLRLGDHDSRSAPAKAIIAPLSVQSEGSG